MIKMICEQKNYEYENVGSQPFDMKTVIELIEDANIEQAIATYLHFLRIAGYTCLSKKNVIEAVVEYFDSDYYK